MVDILRTPWILPSVLEAIKIGGGSDGLTINFTPKLVQLIEYNERVGMVTGQNGILSDRFNYIVAVFSAVALERFKITNHSRSMQSIKGGILRLLRISFSQIPPPPPQNTTDGKSTPQPPTIVMCVDAFEFVGSEGCSIHGEPRYVVAVPAVQQQQRDKSQSSIASFSGSTGRTSLYGECSPLDPEELFLMATTFTPSPYREETSTEKTFPEVIRDADCIIPDDPDTISTSPDATTLSNPDSNCSDESSKTKDSSSDSDSVRDFADPSFLQNPCKPAIESDYFSSLPRLAYPNYESW